MISLYPKKVRNLKKITIVLLISCFQLFQTAFAKDMRFRKITMEEGLSHNSVLCVQEDHYGMMWIGTRGGLNKYNGVETQAYKYDVDDSLSLSNNHVNCIFETRQNDIWVGTANGLNKYVANKDGFINYFLANDSSGLSNKYVKCITENENGQLFIGTSDGLNLFNAGSHSFEELFIKEAPTYANNIITLFTDSQDRVWVGTKGGIFLFDEESKRFSEVGIKPTGYQETDPFEIRDVKQDDNGVYWVATEDYGLLSFNYSNDEAENVQWYSKESSGLISNQIRKILIDNQNLWLATLDGVSILNKGTGEVTNVSYSPAFEEGISNTSIHDVIKDRSGGFWLATYTGGVNYYHPQINLFAHYRNKLGVDNTINSDVVHGFWENNEGELFITTGDGGLDKLDKNTGEIKYFTSDSPGGISSNNIKSMVHDEDGNLWIGTYYGLNFFDAEKETFSSYFHDPLDANSLSHNQVHAVHVDSDGLVWLGLNGGIFQVFDPSDESFHDFPEIGNIVNVIFEDSHQRIWTAGSFGLNCLDRKTQTLVDISHLTQGIEEHLYYVNWITEDSKGNIWLCTSSSGIFIFKEGKSYSFNESNGLNDNTVNALIEDDFGDYWISTNKGVSQLMYSESQEGIPHVSTVDFSVVNGLQGLQFEPGSAYKGPDGMIYFGGVNGYNTFYPDNVSREVSFPSIVFSELQVNFRKNTPNTPESVIQKPVNEIEELVLNYGKRNLRLRFAGINYINPHRVYYRYLLSGLDQGWIDLGTQGSLNFTYLPVGEHELRIKASTINSEWGDNYRSLIIKVLPPWWQTWWAYSLYFIAFLLFLFLFRNYSRRWALLKNKLRMEQFRREKEVELNESKLTFFTDVSHELRTPLTLILAPLEKLMDHNELSDQLNRQLLYIQKNGIRMMHLIDKVLNLRKLETGNEKLQASRCDIVSFLREINLAFSEMASSREIQFEFFSHTSELMVWFDRDKLEIIIYNLLSNAFKHTPSGGSIQMKLEIKKNEPHFGVGAFKTKGNDYLEISISDTGKGIPEENLKTIFERFYSDKTRNSLDVKGIGVGLELTRRMVDLHKGKILVESRCKTAERDGFTKFSIFLHADDSYLNSDEKIADLQDYDDVSLYPKEMQIREKFSHKNSLDEQRKLPNVSDDEVQSLLIVEDNDEVRYFIKDLFVDNYDVKEAVNGVDGLARALEIIPDLIISDIMMPEMNGIEFCRSIKTDARTSHIPVILLTARTTFSFKKEGLETGADDYITKPFSAQFLKLRVKNFIKQRELLRSHFQRKSLLEPGDVKITSVDERLLKKAVDYITENIEDSRLSVERLSNELGLSRMHFYRKIKALTNLSASEFIRSIRLRRAASLLEQNKLSIKEVQNMVGFENADYFRKCFKEQFEVTPSDYQKQHAKG
jgi:signal transduction histidine kinase/ligand-binding sensor domain-containing protein/DNA-binding response OmpR family regulator